MLNPSQVEDRLDYGEILAPPVGYTLDFAVGTTYSLDLDALVGACLSLGLSEETDSKLLGNPVCVLEALRSTGSKLALFCESGQIHMPNKITPLYVLLEKMVFPVKPKKKRGIAKYPSFHPKFWLLRYKNKNGNFTYRIIVLSRNLTFDRSWDIAYFMNGEVSKEASDKNEPICDFLRYLQQQLPKDENGKNKKAAINSLIKELPDIEFKTEDKAFYDFEFIPNGIKHAEGDNYYQFNETALFKNTFHEILIISPFISSTIIKNFNDRNNYSKIEGANYILITREMSLSKLKHDDVSNFKIYTMDDRVVDGAASVSEDAEMMNKQDEDPEMMQKQDIHAKVYMIRKNSDSDLYLGSLNASHNAVYGNVEFMICLKSKRRYLNVEKLTGDLFCQEENNPFQEVILETVITDDTEDESNEMKNLIKEFDRSNPIAHTVQEDDETYSLHVCFDKCATNGYEVTICPLLSKRAKELNPEIIFDGLTISQLSEFYVIAVSNGNQTVRRVLMIPTDGLPDEREKQVVSSVINNRDSYSFYRYIAFLLGDDVILSMLETNKAEEENHYAATRHADFVPSLYEKMLKTAATNPEKFDGIEYLMKTISDDGVIPEDFKALYETFKKVVKNHG